MQVCADKWGVGGGGGGDCNFKAISVYMQQPSLPVGNVRLCTRPWAGQAVGHCHH